MSKGGKAELLWWARVLPHHRHVGKKSADGNWLPVIFLCIRVYIHDIQGALKPT